MSLSYSQLIGDLKENGAGEAVTKFYELLFNKNIEYHINGFTLISMMHPHLSGIGRSPESFLGDGLTANILFALDYNGIEVNVNTSNVQGYITYATAKSSSGQVSCSYIDSSALHIYSFHKLWIDYIDAVRLGVLEPSGHYIDTKTLDYVGSIYAVSFKPDMTSPVYTSKSIGIFPVTLGDKEILGSRTDNAIGITPISYQCASYKSEVGRGALYSEFLNTIGGF